MNNVNQWAEVSLNSFIKLGEKLMNVLPDILGALLLLLLGWIIAKLVSRLIVKLFEVLKFNDIVDKFNESKWVVKSKFKIVPSKIIGRFVYWVILLLFFITASETLGWTAVSDSINQLIIYLPKLFSAILIFVVGLYIGNLVRDIIVSTLDSFEISSAKILSEIAFYVIVVIIATTALEQAGIDTTLITSNITIIIGSIFIAFAVSFGISSRDVFRNILSSFYGKNNFHVGQKIKINDKAGEIIQIDKMHCVLKTKDGKWIFPASKLISEEIEIIEN